MNSNEWFTFMVKKPKLFLPVKDLPVLINWCFARLKLGAAVPGLPKTKSKVTRQSTKTKDTPGELGSMGLPILNGEEGAFSGGTKQLPLSSCGEPWLDEVIPEDIWETGNISPKGRPESPELAALPEKASEEPQPQWGEAAEPEWGAFWCFVTVCWCLAGDTLH